MSTELHFIRDVEYIAGSSVKRDLNVVPPVGMGGLPNYVKAIHLQATLVLASAATSDAIPQTDWSRVISGVEFFDNVGARIITDNPIPGRALRAALTYLRGVGYQDPAALAANSNTTNTRQINLMIPLWLEDLVDSEAHLALAARFTGGNIQVTWCGATEFGTGQVITAASTKCGVFFQLMPRSSVEASPDLIFGTKAPEAFQRYRLPLGGRILFLGMYNPSKAGVVASNDLTDIDLMGSFMRFNRMSIDAPTKVYNLDIAVGGDGDEATKALPTSGSAEDFPIYRFPVNAQMSDLPLEPYLEITVVVGAGAPALTKLEYLYIYSRAKDLEMFARGVGTSSLPYTSEEVRKSLNEDSTGHGLQGGVDSSHRMWGWVRTKMRHDLAKK